MPGTPIQTLIVDDMVTRLQAMNGVGYGSAASGDAYTYSFDRVEKVKENAIDRGQTERLAVVYSGDVTYLNAGMQGVAITGNKLAREMPFVVEFMFPATPTDPTDPLSTRRDEEAVLMFADIHKCLASMQHVIIANSAVEIFFGVDMKDQTDVEKPLVWGALPGNIRFRHNFGDATTHT